MYIYHLYYYYVYIRFENRCHKCHKCRTRCLKKHLDVCFQSPLCLKKTYRLILQNIGLIEKNI